MQVQGTADLAGVDSPVRPGWAVRPVMKPPAEDAVTSAGVVCEGSSA